jgi:ParB-like chromosome segregation protein Spo0J
VLLIGESLTRFGQVRPILTDGRRIIAGNHTYQAAVDLGWTHIAAVANDWADGGEARAYLLADNRLGELGDYEQELLLAHLTDVEAAGSWEGTGYQPDDLEDLRSLHNRIRETDPEPFAGDFAASPEEIAARAARLAAGNTFRELVLTLTSNQNAAFEGHLKILRKEYGDGGGVTETVYRALAEQAALA